jgi:hypothetical protein
MALLGYKQFWRKNLASLHENLTFRADSLFFSWFSGKEHSIAVAEKTIFPFDRMAVGRHGLLVAREGAYQSQ